MVCGTQLNSLYLAQNEFLTGEGLSVLEGKLINLETLDMSGCSRLNGQGLTEILQICGTKLKYLRLYETSPTVKNILETIQLSGPNLTVSF